MRILLLTSTLVPQSGWGTYSLTTAEGLRDKGHDVIVLAEEGHADGMRVERALPRPLAMMNSPKAWLMSALAVRRAVKIHKPDLIHVLAEPYAIALPLAALLCTLPPWVMNLHGTYSALPLIRRRTRPLFAAALRRCSGFLVCSEYTLERSLNAVSRYGAASLSRHLRSNARMFRFGMPPSPSVLPRTDSGGHHLLYVGGIKERKGILELLQACVAYRHMQPAFQLTLVGLMVPDAYSRKLQAYINDHDLQHQVRFTGNISDDELEKLYASADVFIMLSKSDPYYFEGFGLVFLEAVQRGIPAIGSRDSGCREAIEDGVSGYVVDADDARNVAERLRNILDEHMINADACRAWAEQHTVAQQIARFEEVYAEAVMHVHPSA